MQRILQRSGVAAVALMTVALMGFGALPAGQPDRASAERTDKSGTAVEPVDLNRATAEELMTVPGIGKAMAARILEFRKEHGPFKRVDDLMKIKGIGEKSLQKMRPHFKVGRAD